MKEDTKGEAKFLIASIGCIALIIWGILYIRKLQDEDRISHYYMSTYEVHYVDGPVNTAYVVGPYSNEESVDYSTTTNYDSGTGYNFCGVQGICRVRLLHYKKSYPQFGATSCISIKFKNNK